MTRLYHSASSVKLGARCRRAWAYCYLDGLRDPDVPWTDAIEDGAVKIAPRVRSLSLGKAVHAVGESYFRFEPVRWERLPGAIYASGVGALPAPSACETIEVERAIGDTPREGTPGGRVMLAHGIAWAGFRDLVVHERGAAAVLQVDYKTSSNIAAWALSSEALASDLQCAIYTVDLARRLRVDRIASRWLYLETKRVRRALPVDATMTLDAALATLEPAAALARELDALERSSDAPANTEACHAYGGCQYHVSAGGPCSAPRSIAAFFEQHKGDRMALDPALVAKFGALPSPAAAPPPAPAPAFGAQPAPAAAPAVFPPAPPAAAPAPAPRRGRPPKNAAAAAPAPAFGATPAPAPVAPAPAPAPVEAPAPADGVEPSLAEQLAAAVSELAACEAALAEARDAYAAAVVIIRELLAGAGEG